MNGRKSYRERALTWGIRLHGVRQKRKGEVRRGGKEQLRPRTIWEDLYGVGRYRKGLRKKGRAITEARKGEGERYEVMRGRGRRLESWARWKNSDPRLGWKNRYTLLIERKGWGAKVQGREKK